MVGTFARVDLILDDFALDALDSTESRDSATDRFMSDGYDLVIGGQSHRSSSSQTLAKERRPA